MNARSMTNEQYEAAKREAIRDSRSGRLPMAADERGYQALLPHAQTAGIRDPRSLHALNLTAVDPAKAEQIISDMKAAKPDLFAPPSNSSSTQVPPKPAAPNRRGVLDMAPAEYAAAKSAAIGRGKR